MNPEKIVPPSETLAGRPMEAQGNGALAVAAAILADAGPLGSLRRQYGDWVPRTRIEALGLASADTMRRAARRGVLRARVAVGDDHRARIEVHADDAQRLFGSRR